MVDTVTGPDTARIKKQVTRMKPLSRSKWVVATRIVFQMCRSDSWGEQRTNNYRVSSLINPCSVAIIKVDTGASKTFTWIKNLQQLKKLERIKDGPAAILPDSTIIQPSHKGYLGIPSPISSSAKASLVYLSITNESLLSIRQFCDNDCIALFTKAALYIFKNDKIVIQGCRNKKDGLWDIPFQSKQQNLPPPSKPTTTSINHIF